MTDCSLSAVLLAGGESRRMGTDKATLVLNGTPLWQIQLDLLRRLKLAEIFLSARTDPDWRPRDVRFVADHSPSCGPLSGLAASLGQIKTTHLLALAIDMPFMKDDNLRFLYGKIQPGCGVLPLIDNRAEPLAAIYPIEAAIDASAALAGPDFSMQSLTNRLVQTGKMRVVQVSGQDRNLYRNLNERADLEAHEPRG